MAFAWIEPGAHFQGCQLSDVTFRTARVDNVIAIGNYDADPQAQAAIYVKGNALGVRQMPVAGQALSVQGNLWASDAVTSARVQTDEVRLGPSAKVFANDAGLLEARVAIADKYYVRSATVNEVYIYNVSIVNVLDEETSTNLDAIEVVIHEGFYDQLSDAPAIIKGRSPFRVFDIKINEDGRCALTLVPQVQFAGSEFFPGESATFQILSESSSRGVGNQLIFNFEKVLCDQCTLDYNPLHQVEEGILTISTKRSDLPVLILDECVYASTRRIRNVDAAFPAIAMRLLAIETDDTDVAKVRFRNIDARQNLASLRQLMPEAFASSTILYLYPLKSIPPPILVDQDVLVGYAVDSRNSRVKYVVKDSSALSDLVTTPADSFAIDTMILGTRPEQPVAKTYASGPAQYTLDAMISDDFFRCTRETLAMTLRGVPMMILESSQTASSNVIDVLVTAEFASARQVMLRTHRYLFIMVDNESTGMWQIDGFSTEERRLTLSTPVGVSGVAPASFVLSDTIVHVLPLAFTRYIQVGEDQIVTYVPTALGIGTTDVTDTLTVNGTATVKERVTMQARTSNGAPFFIVHDDDNRTLTLGSNFVVHEAGVVSAQDFVKFSDRRLKSHIERLDESIEFEALNKINVSRFRYKDTGRPARGVIAQELQSVMPDAVYAECKMLPVACTYVPLTEVNNAANTVCIDRATVDKLLVDWTADDVNRIRFVCAGATYYAALTRAMDSRVCIKASAALPAMLLAGDLICITGIEVRVMCVDYDAILSSCICSIQYLSKNLRKESHET